MKNVLGMCLNWKVLAGLGVVAIGLWVIAPQLVLAALPLLLLAACPLSMALMAWTMRGKPAESAGSVEPSARVAALEREQARLHDEIARARAELPAPQGRASERSQS